MSAPPDRPTPARPSKPTPVRALDDAPPTRREEPGPPLDRTHLLVDGRRWTAEAVGQARAAGGSDVLLVRFTPDTEDGTTDSSGDDPSMEAGSPPHGALEAWVVGARLPAIAEDRLAEALQRATPWRGKETTAPFFTDEGGRRGR